MATGDDYEIITKFTYLGQLCYNRYYYRQISVGEEPALDDIVNAWLLQVYPHIQAVTLEDSVLTQIDIINLSNPLEFDTINPLNADGDLVGSTMPSYVSWTFRLDRSTREFRPGRKSFQGVGEGSTIGNEPTAGILPDLTVLADSLAEFLVTPIAGATLRPKLLRTATGVGVIADANVTGASFTALSTQNSRKKGVGV